ncbi:hypothetical protein, partial [Stenotrophomonas maltophilia]|uniref:hypothetical protein n=1 Tax=Stenotrophomonas maltophilia TaxID=40324 RepID=UPI001955C8FA
FPARPATEWKKKIKGKSGSRAALCSCSCRAEPMLGLLLEQAAEHGLGSTISQKQQRDAAKPRPSQIPS